MGIFAVHVEQQDMGLRILSRMRRRMRATVQDLPVPVEPRIGEMLAQHLVDLDHGGNGGLLRDVPHADGGFRIAGIGLAQLLGGGAVEDVAQRGIAGDAAAEGQQGSLGRPWSSSPKNSTSMMRSSCSSLACEGMGEESAETMQSDTERGVSTLRSVPISGVLFCCSPSSASMRMTACAPVTATIRPTRSCGWGFGASGASIVTGARSIVRAFNEGLCLRPCSAGDGKNEADAGAAHLSRSRCEARRHASWSGHRRSAVRGPCLHGAC